MAQIRSDLGSDALILSTRRVDGGVEVSAALEPASDPAPPLDIAPSPGRMEGLAWHGVPTSLAARLAHGPFAAALSTALQFRPLDLGAGSPPLLLVGPPGAGKTLTTARLATRLVMAGERPMVITADDRRAGGPEQLAAFTRLLGLTLIVACQPVPLARSLARREGSGPTLIDTPGLNPFNKNELDELAAMASAAEAVIVFVLPAGMDANEAADLAGEFANLGATRMIATRLDLVRRLGGVLAAAEGGLALSEAGIGPGAADGLTPLTPEFLAARLAVPAAPMTRTRQDAA